MGEGSMADWSALFIHDELGGNEGISASGFAAFSTTMLPGRFPDDVVIEKVGKVRIIRAAGAVRFGGMLLALLPGSIPMAIAGCAILGIGVSVVIPIVYSTAGSIPDIPSSRAVAAVATIGYAGFLAEHPVLGWIVNVTSLQVALLIVAGMIAGIIALASALAKDDRRQVPG
jgi:MFS family permease